MRYDEKIIVLALDMYFNGLSIRKVARILNDHFDSKIHQSTVHYWVSKHIPKIAQSMSDIMINNGTTTLHIDEMFVKTRGTTHPHHLGYLWNVMDGKSRFLFTTQLTETRDARHAKRAIKNALHQLRNKPKKVITDRYQGYYTAVPKTGIPHEPHAFEDAKNNKVERLNGTIRSRTKTLKGFKSINSAIPAGIMLNYNYVSPHSSLNNKTPAQAIGIFKERLRWRDLWDKTQ